MAKIAQLQFDNEERRLLEEALSDMKGFSAEINDVSENILSKIREASMDVDSVLLYENETDVVLLALSEIQRKKGAAEDYLAEAKETCKGVSFIPVFSDAEILWLYLAASPANHVQVTLKDGTRVDLRPGKGCPSIRAMEEFGEGVYRLSEESLRHFVSELRNRTSQEGMSKWDEICAFVREKAVWLPARVGAITSEGEILELRIKDRRFLNPPENEMEMIRMPDIPAGNKLEGKCYVLAYPALSGKVRPMLGDPLEGPMFPENLAVSSETAKNALYGQRTVFGTRYTLHDISEYISRTFNEELDEFGLLEDRSLLERVAANFEDDNPYDAIDKEVRSAFEYTKEEIAEENRAAIRDLEAGMR